MDDGRVLALLAVLDREPELPRLGGMARPDGVLIATERFWAFVGDSGLREGAMPRMGAASRSIPLVRGLLRLVAALSPLFRTGAVARPRDRLVLAAALLLPVPVALLPQPAALFAGIAMTVGFLAWLLRGRTLRLHGAEHRAIAAAESRRLAATWLGHARPSRFALRCGTNFASIVLPITFLAQEFWPFGAAAYTPLPLTLVSLAVSMELWQAVHAAPPRLARLVLVPGLALQRLTTREPGLDETRCALRAAAAVLSRELGDEAQDPVARAA